MIHNIHNTEAVKRVYRIVTVRSIHKIEAALAPLYHSLLGLYVPTLLSAVAVTTKLRSLAVS